MCLHCATRASSLQKSCKMLMESKPSSDRSAQGFPTLQSCSGELRQKCLKLQFLLCIHTGRLAELSNDDVLRPLTFVLASFLAATGRYVGRQERPRNEWAALLDNEAPKTKLRRCMRSRLRCYYDLAMWCQLLALRFEFVQMCEAPTGLIESAADAFGLGYLMLALHGAHLSIFGILLDGFHRFDYFNSDRDS